MPPNANKKNEEYTILFDGYCNLCIGSINFIKKYDVRNHFNYHTLTSNHSVQLLESLGIDDASQLVTHPNSFILINKSEILTKSDAWLFILKNINGWPRVLSFINIVPKKIRDYFYDIIGKYRYTIFGKQKKCYIDDK